MSAPDQPGARASAAVRSAKRQQGLAFARAWRLANKPYFDALYGPEPQR